MTMSKNFVTVVQLNGRGDPMHGTEKRMRKEHYERMLKAFGKMARWRVVEEPKKKTVKKK